METNNLLKCPICDHEMFKGYIPNFKDNVAWYPFERKFKFKFPYVMAKNSINLLNYEENNYYCIAYFCDYCKKIIIDVPEPIEREKSKIFKGYTFDSKKE